MLTIEECKKFINPKQRELTNEQLKKIIELFYCWANIEFSNYQKNEKNEKCNIVQKSFN